MELNTKEREAQKPTKTLIVEDDEIVSEFLQEVVGRFSDMEVSSADSVSEASKILEAAKKTGELFDLVISDLGLKDDAEGGFKLAKKLREENPTAYFILVTGNASMYKLEELKRKDIDQVLGKPVQLSVLTSSLNQAKERITEAKKVAK